jgi:hypothetical protein
MGQNNGVGGRRIDTYTNGVWCEVFSYENYNGKTCSHFGIFILNSMYDKYGV